jgi:hypothetical protein
LCFDGKHQGAEHYLLFNTEIIQLYKNTSHRITEDAMLAALFIRLSKQIALVLI